MRLRTTAMVASLYALAIVAGCDKNDPTLDDAGTDATTDAGPDAGPTSTFYAIDDDGLLVRFTRDAPGTIDTMAISGLQTDEEIIGLDVRPSDQQLFALGTTSRVYTINTETGVATPAGPQFMELLSGSYWGVDVNPAADNLRILNVAQQNVRVSFATGDVTNTDTVAAFATGDTYEGVGPHLVECVYTNNVPSAPTTALYAIDANLDVLVLVNPPNMGELHTIGALGIDAQSPAGFDVVTEDGVDTAYAALAPNGATASALYTVNLSTGAATFVGAIGGEIVHALTYRE